MPAGGIHGETEKNDILKEELDMHLASQCNP